jgi:rhodanese-related sulfurtransferase
MKGVVMRRCFLVISIIILLVTSCTQKNNNITFVGIIENVTENDIMVKTNDDVGFDKASVRYDKNLEIKFVPEVGQKVKVEIYPEIRESYPVQVTGINIELVNDEMNNKTEYKKISSEEAKEIIDSEDTVVLDVRTQDEYDSGHIEQAVLLPVTEIEKRAFDVLTNKDEKILVYCRSGNRSATASKLLIEMGYTNVYDFGGIIDWPYEIVK